MIIVVLSNIAKCFYPFGISELMDVQKYNQSIEHKYLISILGDFENKLRNDFFFDEYIAEFKKIRPDFYFQNVTLFNSCDRALNLQLTTMIGNKLHSICINLSILVPYYTYYILETEVDIQNGKWIRKPSLKKELEILYKDEIKKICELTETKFKFSKFPSELLGFKLPDISRGFIPFGDFTFFNAFFLDDLYTRL